MLNFFFVFDLHNKYYKTLAMQRRYRQALKHNILQSLPYTNCTARPHLSTLLAWTGIVTLNFWNRPLESPMHLAWHNAPESAYNKSSILKLLQQEYTPHGTVTIYMVTVMLHILLGDLHRSDKDLVLLWSCQRRLPVHFSNHTFHRCVLKKVNGFKV